MFLRHDAGGHCLKADTKPQLFSGLQFLAFLLATKTLRHKIFQTRIRPAFGESRGGRRYVCRGKKENPDVTIGVLFRLLKFKLLRVLAATSIVAFLASSTIKRNTAPGSVAKPSPVTTTSITSSSYPPPCRGVIIRWRSRRSVYPFMIFDVLISKNKCRSMTMPTRGVVAKCSRRSSTSTIIIQKKPASFQVTGV